VTKTGEVRLIDFGIASIEQHTHESSIEVAAHTPAYASPEQKNGEPASMVSDIFALGKIISELIERPLRHSRLGAFQLRQLYAITAKATHLEQNHRYQSVSDLKLDLIRWRTKRPVNAVKQTSIYRLRAFIDRNRTITTIALGAFTAITIALLVTLKSLQQSRQNYAQLVLAKSAVEEESNKLNSVNQFMSGMFGSIDTSNKGIDVKVVEILASASQQLKSQTEQDPRIATELYFTIAMAYDKIGAEDQFLKLLIEGENLSLKTLGAGHPQTIKLRNQQITYWMRLDAFNKVLEKTQPWIKQMQDANTNPENIYKMQIRSAEALYWNGDKETALNQLLDLEQSITTQLGTQNKTIGFLRETLGVIYLWDKRASDSEPVFRKNIDLYNTLFGVASNQSLDMMFRLSLSLDAQARYDEAIVIAKNLLHLKKKNQAGNAEIANAYNTLGVYQQNAGYIEPSIKTLETAVREFEPVLGQDNPRVSFFYLNLGDAYQQLSDYQKALEWYSKGISLEQILAADIDTRDVRTVIQMSQCHTRLNNKDEAKLILDVLQPLIVEQAKISNLGGNEHSFKAALALWVWSFHSNQRGLEQMEQVHDDAIETYGHPYYITQEILKLRLEFYQQLNQQDSYDEYAQQLLSQNQ